MLGLDAILVARLDGRRKALRERLGRRAVVQVLQPLLGGSANALLLLLDVRHGVKNPRSAGSTMVAKPLR